MQVLEGLWKLFPKVKQGMGGGGGWGHQKVSGCMSLDESVHDGSLYCCVYFLVTHFNETAKTFSINNKVTLIVALHF